MKAGFELIMIVGSFLLVLLLVIFPSERAHQLQAQGICANESLCDSNCERMVDMFKANYSHGWAVRHSSIALSFNKLGCREAVEIGVARGELSNFLLKNVKELQHLHGVDPFLGGYDDKNDATSLILSHVNASLLWSQAVLKTQAQFGCRYKHHFGRSKDVIEHFANESLDCVFIDGDHTYEGCKLDIRLFAPKLKKGGYFFFDDFSSSFMGVVNAVDELEDNNNITKVKINKHNNYYVQKPLDRPLTGL